MKVIKIKTDDGQKFVCKPEQRIRLDRVLELAGIEEGEMTEKEYQDHPATGCSSAFFSE